jgi:hypothetical protein
MEIIRIEYDDVVVTAEFNNTAQQDINALASLGYEISDMSKIVYATSRNRNSLRYCIETIVDTFGLHLEGFREVLDREIVLGFSSTALNTTVRPYKDGSFWDISFSSPSFCSFRFPVTVSLTRTPGVGDDDYCHDECWASHPSCAPVDEHDKDCPLRAWMDGDYVTEPPECYCDFSCECEPMADHPITRTFATSDELFAPETIEWFNGIIL